ncbi:phenylacetaldoxime dehydratase family protein [Xanthobacter sp. KR7-65]|uniref:phenylacetaldoxime dehydratase family protein n=1 Tax=Xanthobacter sp. KR7-65 TaxID=3156612 RepID=UPI0032B4236D
MSEHPERLYPMNRPAGHVPPIIRYSARFDHAPGHLAVLFVGMAGADDARAEQALGDFLAAAAAAPSAPAYLDRAAFVDAEGRRTVMAALYWPDRDAFGRWVAVPDIAAWRAGQRALAEDLAQWWEPVSTVPERAETIAFAEYRRGLSACPFSRLEEMGETGYWGAARDRIPASGWDRLDGAAVRLAPLAALPAGRGQRLAIRPPTGLTVIRSGVSWAACGAEQRESYERNVRPKLDAGMDYLRENPAETGCPALRQVVLTDAAGQPLEEAYSLGLFLSLHHLETWAKHHPTHLAIYHRAMAERRKYQEALELRTYNEIYVLDGDALDFEYVNCPPSTGLIPYFEARILEAAA